MARVIEIMPGGEIETLAERNKNTETLIEILTGILIDSGNLIEIEICILVEVEILKEVEVQGIQTGTGIKEGKAIGKGSVPDQDLDQRSRVEGRVELLCPCE